VLVLTRYRVADSESASFAAQADAALAALSARTGFVDGHVARNVDDPQLWTLTTRWDGVGSYRRALSAVGLRDTVAPIAVDPEPGVSREAGNLFRAAVDHEQPPFSSWQCVASKKVWSMWCS